MPAPELPSGTVTMLFTDVEGSTKLLIELGDGYADALHEHRRILREAAAAHDGVEVDNQGDALFIAFGRTSDAIAAATQAQQALETGPIRVRMGIHTGEPRLTEEGYVGLDVHKAARIAAAGHGGQVLLSSATYALSDADAIDLGRFRLKDLSVPEPIYQLRIPGLRSSFPPLKTLETGMKNLTTYGTSFLGRDEELTEIERRLDDPTCRLVTLTGPGGVGKTRLALEAADRRAGRYAHGVHLVSLASVATADMVVPAIADTLQFAIDGSHSGFSALDQLLDYLAERELLLVLDNFEHLVGGAGVVTELLERVPALDVLVTSRERLDLQSEWVLDVGGLGTDDGETGRTALHLFVERARWMGAEVAQEEDRDEVMRVCRLVGGMPLGIELAAAWTSVLSCREIADEIERGIGFLESSARDLEDRHRSLRATFDGSWVLLTAEQRRALAELSVLRGAFTREAAEAVAGANLRTLLELANRSLLRRSPLGRFELHELIRQYAAGHLAASSSEHDAAHERHARFYIGLLKDRHEGLLDERMVDSRDELQLEGDNLLEAAAWAVEHWGEGDALDVIATLYDFYWMQSWFEGVQGLRRLEDLVEPGTPPADAGRVRLSLVVHRNAAETALAYEERLEAEALECLPRLRELEMTRELGKCLTALGTLACYVDVYDDSIAYLEEAVEVTAAANDGIEFGAAQSWLGFSRLLVDDIPGARTAFEAGHDAVADMGNVVLRAYLMSKLGLLADAESVFDDALRIHLQASDLFASAGDAGGTGYALSRASGSAYMLGDMQEAMRLGIAGYEGFAEVNHRWGMIGALSRIAFASIALGDLPGARMRLRDALERAHASHAHSLEMLALSGVGVLLEREGKRREAAEILTFALDPLVLPRLYSLASRPVLEELERTLPPDVLAEVQGSAANLKLDDLVDEALRRHLA